MAERLDDYDFQNPDRHERYPWEEWLDGSVWKLKYGEDVASQSGTFTSHIHHAAKRAGVRVRTSHREEGYVIIQAYRPDDDRNGDKA